MDQKVLITSGAGAVGGEVARAFTEIVTPTLTGWKNWKKGDLWIEIDLCDVRSARSRLREARLVVHRRSALVRGSGLRWEGERAEGI